MTNILIFLSEKTLKFGTILDHGHAFGYSHVDYTVLLYGAKKKRETYRDREKRHRDRERLYISNTKLCVNQPYFKVFLFA